MIRTAAAIVLAAGLSTAVFAAAPGDTRGTLEAMKAEAKSGPSAKLGAALNALYKASQASAPGSGARSLAFANKVSRLQKLLRATDGFVTVDIALKGDAAGQRATFEAAGLTNISTYENHLSGRAPISALLNIAGSPAVRVIRPALSKLRVGLTTTQGDKSQRSDDARRAFGVNGSGVKVGVLSDSFNCSFSQLVPDPEATFTTAAQDLANGDLPQVQVLKDDPGPDCSETGTDEGRAMLQLVHDVAPGSPLAFYTANVSETDFAAGIVELADAGARVIVDDVLYFAEPMFQDGVVAQAVDQVKARGVAYFSSAGNDARQSYEAAFKRSDDHGGLFGGERHNFGTRQHPDTMQLATLDPDSITLMAFQWDEPYASVNDGAGSRSDLDVVFYDTKGALIPPCNDNLEPAVCQFPGIDENVAGDPYEQPIISNSSDSSVDVNISIEMFLGPPPGRMKYVWFDLSTGVFHLDEFVTDSGTAYGHANAAGAEAVGAAPWYNTAEWHSPLWGNKCRPACLEYFSSAGGVPILFDKNGHRLPHSIIRLKPGVTGPDGGNTSFFVARLTDPAVGDGEPDKFPNFFGTSASAPHVAAIAALMIDQMKRNDREHHSFELPGRLVPDFIYTTLRATAEDVRYRAGRTIAPFAIEDSPRGFDFDSGFGYVNAFKAVKVVRTLHVSTD